MLENHSKAGNYNVLKKGYMVSVCMIAYNQEEYIQESIEGILKQKCNFDYELVIGEDCSTDKTRQICQEYASKHSNINLLFSETNLGMTPNFIRTLQACTSRYIALCEGDDYWTDPYKLQKQVAFLEENDDFSICFHNLTINYDDGREAHLSNSPDQKDVTTIEDLAHGNYIYTASCVFRNGLIKKFPDWYNSSPVGDYVLHMLNAQYGKIKFIPDVMGIYRVYKAGIWENTDYIIRIEKWVELLELMKNYFNQEVSDILIKIQSNYYSDLIKYYHNNAEKCKYYSKLLIDSNALSIIELNRKIEKLRNKNEAVLNSKTYKVGAFILKPYSFLKRILNL